MKRRSRRFYEPFDLRPKWDWDGRRRMSHVQSHRELRRNICFHFRFHNFSQVANIPSQISIFVFYLTKGKSANIRHETTEVRRKLFEIFTFDNSFFRDFCFQNTSFSSRWVFRTFSFSSFCLSRFSPSRFLFRDFETIPGELRSLNSE